MVNYRLLLIVALLIAACGYLGLAGLEIDTDVVRSLPEKERVVADGLEFFEHHPVHDQVAVDVRLDVDDRETLVECGAFVERRMEASGLFTEVGNRAMGHLLPGLALHAASHLPLLFSADELEGLAPLLTPERIGRRLDALYAGLGTLEGIGQAPFIAADPLGLRERVLARMQPLAPAMDVTIHRDSLLSADGRHLLVTAKPATAGTDTAFARRLETLFSQTAAELNASLVERGIHAELTPVGAYRAALDNERIIRTDVRYAVLFAVGGIALLLLFSFARPLLGLLSLVPALAGTAAALLIYSLFARSLSIVVLGFGGAIISITVDHGIAYLLFLDRPRETRGSEASHEVRAIGLTAVLTTIYAFLILSVSGFAIFAQLGIFTSLGLLFSFLFIHTVFPRVFPVMPAGGTRRLPLQRLVDLLYRSGWAGAACALLLALVLLPLATPNFQVSLRSMNTVSAATEAADALFADVWGELGDRVFLMRTAASPAALQQENDRLLAALETEVKGGVLAGFFVPSMLFPGPERARRNLEAWRDFWDRERAEQVRAALVESGRRAGFSDDAFAPFLRLLDPAPTMDAPALPPRYHALLGIVGNGEGEGLAQFITAVPGVDYEAAAFIKRHPDSRVFDSTYFAERLAAILFSTFTAMLAIIGVSVALLLLLIHLDPRLTILTLLPAAFALVCTLGTLRLLGRSLDIPALMLSIVIFGLGIDYAIFCVRAHQRYRRLDHPAYGKVRCAVFLSAASTLIGFGVLCFAEHSLLRSIGVTSLLGIGYSLIGAFVLLPPLLEWTYAVGQLRPPGSGNIRARVRRRYQGMEAYPRMFARCKLRFDPMFTDLPVLLEEVRQVGTVIDIGCGFGVPACWCLESFPAARLHGIDPDPERVRVAALAIGDRGTVTRGWAPEMPPMQGRTAELVLLLDMLHYVDDRVAGALLAGACAAMAPGGMLLMRVSVEPPGRPSLSWRLEELRIRLAGRSSWYRTPAHLRSLLGRAGFTVRVDRPSTGNPELLWLAAARTEEDHGRGMAG